MSNPTIEVRGFKWPRRPTYAPVPAHLLGEDVFGRWLGVAKGTPWRSADGSRSGVMLQPLVKLVPADTYWTCCFHPVDPVVDIDLVLPVRWLENTLEEIDLELDVLRFADGRIEVRDQAEFAHLHQELGLPDAVTAKVLQTAEELRALLARNAEPFATVGHERLARFIADPLNHPSSP
jgi:hypothetical protein